MDEPLIGIPRGFRTFAPFTRSYLPEISGVILIAVFALLGALLWEYHLTLARVQHTLEVQRSISTVMSTVQELEGSSRGYMLTGMEDYLQHYREATARIEAETDQLQRITADSPEQQRAVVSLKPLIDAYLAVLREGITLRREAGLGPAVSFVQTRQDQVAMESVRAATSQMDAVEDALYLGRTSAMFRALVSGLIVAGLGFLGVIGSMAGWIWSTRRDGRKLQATLVDREQRESQIRQMQKIEAVGQLAGGLAHDLNNMLAVIISGLALTQKRLAAGDQNVLRFVNAAMDGATRAATLTNRLMAFSRQQPLSPQPIDANRLVGDISELVQRTLGETIRTQTVLNAGLWHTTVDPGQLENAILNLAINARDAMPEGGKLTIETANTHLDDAYAREHDVPEGQYVQIAVTDTGTGMTADVVTKAFDPFFTTKGVGKGTGLGLSQVYGFIKQSGGHVKIYSEPGHGTTIKLYLPRLIDAGPEQLIRAAKAEAWPDMRADNSGHIILVVEDDPRVNEMSVSSLRELGYTVIHADGAKSALEKLDAHPHTELLFTDMVMPDISGRQLAAEAMRRRPDLKVLFTTGFTREAAVLSGKLDAGQNFIAKPFTLVQIATKVNAMLAERTAA